jgi:hypothetical protein
MARPRQRAWLDVGFRLDINALLRAGMRNGTQKARFTNRQEAVIDTHMDEPRRSWGWMRFQSAGVDQGSI